MGASSSDSSSLGTDTAAAENWALDRRPLSRRSGVYPHDSQRGKARAMGKIVVSEQISLDGVVDDPSGVEGTRRGGWVNEMSQADRERWTEHEFAESVAAEALLLGRRSDAWFAARWRERTGEWADRLNAM